MTVNVHLLALARILFLFLDPFKKNVAVVFTRYAHVETGFSRAGHEMLETRVFVILHLAEVRSEV